MKGNKHQVIFVGLLLNFNIFGAESQLEEPNGEIGPSYEYLQIFKSIPTLFEYLLDALEERPEILEKDDVTIFNRNIDAGDLEECDNSDNEKNIEKRDADCDTITAEDDDSNNINKRDTITTKDARKTTIDYEYGNSNFVMKGLDEIEANNMISKTFANNDNFNNLPDTEGVKRELFKREDRIKPKKKSVLFKLDDDAEDLYRSYGDAYLGFEHLFSLDLKPEDIEERILTAEKLLEEHNNKKEDKVKRKATSA